MKIILQITSYSAVIAAIPNSRTRRIHLKNPGQLLLLFLFATGMLVCACTADALAQSEQSPASAAAPAEKVEPPPEANKLLQKGGQIAITKTCGCAAECPEGFNPSEATSCFTAGGDCRDKDKDPKCTLTCKKGKEDKKVDGKCTAVYR
jgi:hypothetical protein